MSAENGPDREIGLWQAVATKRAVSLRLKNGVVHIGDDSQFKGVCFLLELGNAPLDVTAKREAIRAGWREVSGKWEKDKRDPYYYCRCAFRSDCTNGPDCYEAAAKDRGEWPKGAPSFVSGTVTVKPTDEPTPDKTPEFQPAPGHPGWTARQVLGQMRHEAFEKGRQHEREKQAKRAKPCVLKRLGDAPAPTEWEPRKRQSSAEVVVMAHLDAAISSAKRHGIDLSELAERMAKGVGDA